MSKRFQPPRIPHEDPKFLTPDRHSHGGVGTNAHGDEMINSVYKQPWVEHDPVLDHDGTDKAG